MRVVGNEQRGPLFPRRFSLRTLLYATTAACVVFMLGQFMARTESWFALELAFLFFGVCAIAFAGWVTTQTKPYFLGLLLIGNAAIGRFLLIGPIAAYHINGRAWYDYGLSNWNPPPYHYPDGRIAVVDYDPAYTPPFIWPMIGPALYMMSCAGVILMILPPTAPIVAALAAFAVWQTRRVLTPSQQYCVWTLWAIGTLPTIYLIVWGLKVLEWIAD